MDKVDSLLNSQKYDLLRRNIVSNDNVSNSNIGINGINGDNEKNSKYALDRTKFTPNTPETLLAEEIAIHFNDLNNYAGYLNVVNRLGCDRTRILFSTVKFDIKEKSTTKTPVRKPAAYFMWKFRRGDY